ncbi:MAG: hypothetical protein Q7S98_00315 [Deltaproteobacteria bacterium]|nr:hypothetical protein [Deltaproteobacteria bacterium]
MKVILAHRFNFPFVFLLSFALLTARTVCACESFSAAGHDHQQAEAQQDVHEHDSPSEPSHDDCLCAPIDQGVAVQTDQFNPSSSFFVGSLTLINLDLFPDHHATKPVASYHSPPSARPLYITQSSLLI